MRPLQEMTTATTTTVAHLSPPLATPPAHSGTPCNPQIHSCRWWPYSNSNDFGANTAMIVIILLCALICALVLNAAIRCLLRSNNTSHHRQTIESRLQELGNSQPRKPVSEVDRLGLFLMAPTVVYSSGLKFGGAMEVADCAICLSEFVEGEEIRVLGRCNHGFHAHCIEKWLTSHSSCPTCRGSCLAFSSTSPSSRSLENGAIISRNSSPDQPAMTEASSLENRAIVSRNSSPDQPGMTGRGDPEHLVSASTSTSNLCI